MRIIDGEPAFQAFCQAMAIARLAGSYRLDLFELFLGPSLGMRITLAHFHLSGNTPVSIEWLKIQQRWMGRQFSVSLWEDNPSIAEDFLIFICSICLTVSSTVTRLNFRVVRNLWNVRRKRNMRQFIGQLRASSSQMIIHEIKHWSSGITWSVSGSRIVIFWLDCCEVPVKKEPIICQNFFTSPECSCNGSSTYSVFPC